MQTRRRNTSSLATGLFSRLRGTRTRITGRIGTACLSLALTGGMLCSLAGCAMPRYAGKAESEQTMSGCERAYTVASDAYGIARANGGAPAVLRYLAAGKARSWWLDVAASCTGRVAEGTIRSAQSGRIAERLAVRFGLPTATADGHAVLDDVDGSSVDADALTGMALAEDRAGFTVEILTARRSAEATLPAADAHKAAGERLASLASRAGAGDDPRQKVYDVSQLLANVHEIVDPATGLRASTYAVAEINCAREELAALDARNDGAQEASPDSASDAAGSSPTAGASDEAASASDAGGADGTSSDAGSAAESRTTSMRPLASLIASRLERAFAAGYPSLDHALFAE